MPPSHPPTTPDARWAAYAAVAVAWLATRALAVVSVDMTPWMLNDLDIYRSWVPGLLAGRFPVDDPTWQYPPGIAPLFVAADAGGIDYRWGFTLAILLVDATLMGILLWAHARRPDRSWRGPWLWAAAGVVIGPIMVVRFDVVPTLFAVAAVLLAAQPVGSAVASAVGAATKVWPLLMLLVLPRRSLIRAIPVALIALATIAVVVTLTADGGLSFLANQQARGLQVESVGALPYEWWTLLGGEARFDLEYGSIQVLMAGAETVGLVLTLMGLLLLGLVAWWRLRGRLEHVPPGDVALAIMLVSVATSRVYSPQFNVWLVGLASVALLDRACRLRLVSGLVIATSVVTQVVYPWSATQLVTAEPFAIGVQTLRIVLLLTATVLALMSIARRPKAAPVPGPA